MTFKPGQSGNPAGRAKGHGISYWYGKVLEEELKSPVTGLIMTKAEALARKLVAAALSDDISPKEALTIIAEITERREGKAIATNINAEMPVSPFADIDTESLERLKARLVEIKNGGTK